jgi:hypothetical protein
MPIEPVKDLIEAFGIGAGNCLFAVGTIETQHRPSIAFAASPYSQARDTFGKAFYDFLVGSWSEVWLSVIDPLAHIGKTGLFSLVAGGEYLIDCDLPK